MLVYLAAVVKFDLYCVPGVKMKTGTSVYSLQVYHNLPFVSQLREELSK